MGDYERVESGDLLMTNDTDAALHLADPGCTDVRSPSEDRQDPGSTAVHDAPGEKYTIPSIGKGTYENNCKNHRPSALWCSMLRRRRQPIS